MFSIVSEVATPLANASKPTAMVRLTKLPNEVTDLVLHHLSPSDLEAFFGTCKTLRQNYACLLSEHYAMKWSYFTFTYRSDVSIGAPLRLLKDILENPWVAAYVRRLDVEDWTTEHDFQIQPNPPQYKVTTQDRDIICEALGEASDESTDIEGELRIREMLLQDLDDGEEEPLLILLLTLLPNLESIHFVNEEHLDGRGALPSLSKEKPTQALAQLRSVNLEAREFDSYGWADMTSLLQSYCMLPSLRSFSLHNAANDTQQYTSVEDELNAFTWTGPILITRLALTSCSIYSTILSDFLSRCHCLETFEYWPGPSLTNDDSVHGSQHFHPWRILAALEKSCTKTLQSFTLLSKGRRQVHMGSLQAFGKLEEVTTDLKLVMGNYEALDLPGASRLYPPLRRVPRGVYMLSDMLPPRIRHLSLSIDRKPFRGSPASRTLTSQMQELLKIQVCDIGELFPFPERSPKVEAR